MVSVREVQFTGGENQALALLRKSLSKGSFGVRGSSVLRAGTEAIFYISGGFVKQIIFAGGQEELQQAGGAGTYVRKNKL